jgi:hypothetical protein
MAAFQPDNYVQIDVKEIRDNHVICNMYTGVLCVKIAIGLNDYNELTRKGFFIRDGKTKDSAGVLNTTLTYSLDHKQ